MLTHMKFIFIKGKFCMFVHLSLLNPSADCSKTFEVGSSHHVYKDFQTNRNKAKKKTFVVIDKKVKLKNTFYSQLSFFS